MCQLYCCLTSPCLYGRLALNSLHQGIFQLPGQHLAVPRVTSGGSRRRECLKPAKKRALRRPERCAAPVQPCLSPSGLPPTGGKGVSPFPALKYSAPAPCRSGSKGEAPWSPKAKSPFRKLAHGVEYTETPGLTEPFSPGTGDPGRSGRALRRRSGGRRPRDADTSGRAPPPAPSPRQSDGGTARPEPGYTP